MQRPWLYGTQGRLVVAVSVLLGMWLVAWVLVVVGLVYGAPDIDEPTTSSTGEPLLIVCWVAAAGLFLLAGPVTYRISGRRWLLVAPFLLAAVWALGIVVAGMT